VATKYIHKILRLADVVDSLCQAQSELTAAGYGEWGHELDELIGAIDLEIGWLQATGSDDQ
jgi:hypothetical protein